MKGAFVSLSPLPSEPPVQVVITEGYATALTVSQLTAGCVVAAISAGNLPNVAQSLRARWPEVKIIIAGDNDFQDGENPGRAFAERAAKSVGGWMTLPPGEIKADWNDFHREHGITRAREAFRNGLVLCGKAARNCRTGSVLPRNISGMKSRYSATVRRRSRTSKYAARCV